MATLRYIPAIGTEFYSCDEFEEIYENFSDYFEITEEYTYGFVCKIVKEPCEELVKAIDAFNDAISKRESKKRSIYKKDSEKSYKRVVWRR